MKQGSPKRPRLEDPALIKEKLGSRLDRWIQLVFPFLFKRPVNPNVLTLVGALVSMGAAWAFAVGSFRAAGIVLLAGGFFDLVDGVVARHFGTSATFGAFLDSTMDRVVDMAVMLGVLMHYAAERETVPEILAGVVLISSIVTSYAKARAELAVAHIPGGLLERGERIGILAAGAILGLMVPALWLLAIGTTATAFWRIAVAHREMALVDAGTEGAGDPV